MKALLVAIKYDGMLYDYDVSLEELKELAKACHIETINVISQNVVAISHRYYIGKGKVEEIKGQLENVDIVIFNEELSPTQVKNLTEEWDIEVTDRSDLILRIFESRAKTKEAKLQVEIARYQYILPRLIGMRQSIYSQQGGSGFRGSGEKQLEIDRRHIHHQLIQARKELDYIVKNRQTQRKRRKRNDYKVICLVGYTNSGKSSLLNYFSDKKVYQEDMLFASLETASRRIVLKNKQIVIMSDTVGFINQLPHHLVQAFRSTLEEVKEADLLLHVVDASSKYTDMQIQTTNEVLRQLGVEDTPMIYVYNKIDKGSYPIATTQLYSYISVYEKTGLDHLENLIIEELFKGFIVKEVLIPYEDGVVFQNIKQKYEIIHEDYLEKGIYVSFYIDAKESHTYKKYEYRKIN